MCTIHYGVGPGISWTGKQLEAVLLGQRSPYYYHPILWNPFHFLFRFFFHKWLSLFAVGFKYKSFKKKIFKSWNFWLHLVINVSQLQCTYRSPQAKSSIVKNRNLISRLFSVYNKRKLCERFFFFKFIPLLWFFGGAGLIVAVVLERFFFSC